VSTIITITRFLLWECSFLEEKMMKLIHSVVLAVAISAAAVSTVQARDSFSLGINIGGYGYAPPVAYYPAPVYYSEPVVYYSPPVRYYRPAPVYYGYAPTVVSFGYSNYGGHHYRGHHRGHHGWDRDGRGNDGWNRGRGHHDDDD
jgi:hypothetical protein